MKAHVRDRRDERLGTVWGQKNDGNYVCVIRQGRDAPWDNLGRRADPDGQCPEQCHLVLCALYHGSLRCTLREDRRGCGKWFRSTPRLRIAKRPRHSLGEVTRASVSEMQQRSPFSVYGARCGCQDGTSRGSVSSNCTGIHFFTPKKSFRSVTIWKRISCYCTLFVTLLFNNQFTLVFQIEKLPQSYRGGDSLW